MVKSHDSSHIFALVFRLLSWFLVVAAVGPTCTAAITNLTGMSVTDPFDNLDCPVWNGDEKSVYFADQKKRQIIRYESNKTTSIDALSMAFMFLVPVASEGPNIRFVGGEDWSITAFVWDGSSSNITFDKSLSIIKNSNDMIQCGKADNNGRLYVGCSASSDRGMLYMVESSGKITEMLKGPIVPNDFAWNSDGIRMYILDANKNMIVCYEHNIDTGILGKPCLDSFDFNAQNITCKAHRMTIDTTGNLWVSCIGSAYVLQVNVVKNQLMTQVNLPDGFSATSVVFGGDTMEDLYVTTDRNFEQPNTYPKSGTLFQVTNTGYKGYVSAKIDVAWP